MGLSSMTWGYARILAGTLVGGTLGFYVMHRLEMKLEEALRQYEKKVKKRQEETRRRESRSDQ